MFRQISTVLVGQSEQERAKMSRNEVKRAKDELDSQLRSKTNAVHRATSVTVLVVANSVRGIAQRANEIRVDAS